MRIVISDVMSLAGVVQAPGGPDEDTDGGFRHGGWWHRFFDPDVVGASVGEAADRCEGFLYGRRTYTVMAGAWPERAGDPFADFINTAPKYVVSDTLQLDDITWQPTTIIRGADMAKTLGICASGPAATCSSGGALRWRGRCSRTISSTS